jgi:hypothetical protein
MATIPQLISSMQQSQDKLTVPQQVNKSPPLMNPERSLQCSKQPATGKVSKAIPETGREGP